MRLPFMSLCSGVAAVGFLATAAPGALVNLGYSASGTGQLPAVTLTQGSPAGIIDGTMFDWFGAVTSPRTNQSTQLSPYMTWNTPQSFQAVRLFADVTVSWDRIYLDTLGGTGNPAIESDWTQQYDSGAGLGQRMLEVTLPAPVTSQGLRVRAHVTSGDITVGEVQVFELMGTAGFGALADNRLTATGAVASSSIHTTPDGAIDHNFFNRWLSQNQADNPGAQFTLDATFEGETINAVGIVWATQGGWSALPSSWTVQYDDGSGFQDIGTYTATPGRLAYFHNFPEVSDVQALRVLVEESNVAGGLGVAIMELEAFNLQEVPEPGALGLLSLAGLALLRRRMART